MSVIHKIVIGNATLYLGDCLEILPTLPAVPLVVTDPPYLLTSGGNLFQTMGGKFSKDEYENDGEFVPCNISWSDFMPTVYRAVQDGGEAYIMANNRHLTVADSVATAVGFEYHNHLVWHKGTGTRNRWYMKNCEFTLYYYKGKSRRINNCGSMQMVSIPNVKHGCHPTEKPVLLMQLYIENSSQPGDVVLDPFMGSGSTGVAALRSGRRFVGIEKDAKFFDVACRRIAEEAGETFEKAMKPEGLPGVKKNLQAAK